MPGLRFECLEPNYLANIASPAGGWYFFKHSIVASGWPLMDFAIPLVFPVNLHFVASHGSYLLHRSFSLDAGSMGSLLKDG